RGQRAMDVVVVELAVAGDALPEGAGGLLVVERRQRPGMAFIDHQPHRVGADVEDGDRTRAADSSLRGGIGVHAPVVVHSTISSLARANALPRPERLALFMKYSWAL